MARTFLHPDDALKLVFENIEDYGNENISVFDSFNRVLHKEVFAKMDDPPFDKASMDGYAYKNYNGENYDLIENNIIAAGSSKNIKVGEGECVKIMTGAMIPNGCNFVQRIEWTEEIKENGKTFIKFTKKENVANIIKKGNNKKIGEKILDRKFILPKDIAILSGFGYDKIIVKKKINAAVISSGNEIADIGADLKEGEIYDANAPMLLSRVSNLSCNGKFYGKVRDDENEIRHTLNKAINENDMVLITGGVSMGDFDYVHKILRNIGVSQIFHGLAMKPGKPLFFGKLGNKAVFALPGNSVSAYMTFEIIVKPYILSSLGLHPDNEYIKAILSEDFNRHDAQRLEYVPVKLYFENTKLYVKLIKYNNSSMISSFSEANGVLKIDIGIELIKSGDIVDVRFV